MNTIQDKWKAYRDSHVKPGTSAMELRLIKRAFYYGARGLMEIQYRISADDFNEDAAQSVMETISEELYVHENV